MVSDAFLAATAGFGGGLLLGLAARLGRFCTLGAIEDAIWGEDWRRVRMWALALGLTIPGVFALEAAGQVDLSRTLYAGIAWNPVASVIGGLVFGYGMALAGNCGYGALARAGGGDIGSVVIVLVMAISAYMAIAGPTGWLRAALFPEHLAVGARGYAHAAGAALGTGPLLPAFVIGAGLSAWALMAPEFRRSRPHVVWSIVVALAIVSGWWAMARITATSFEVLEMRSHSFTAPLGQTLIYLMTSTGGGLGFGVGSVAGVVAGACLGSLRRGHFRWEACDDPRELGRQMLGAFLMGTGGVMALGCSVGQGLSAMATLTWSAPVVLAAIVVGAALGLRQLIRGFDPV